MSSTIDTTSLEAIEHAAVTRRGAGAGQAGHVAEAKRQYLSGRDSVGPFLRRHGVDVAALDRARQAQRATPRPRSTPPAPTPRATDVWGVLNYLKTELDRQEGRATPPPRPPTAAEMRAETDALRQWAARHQPPDPNRLRVDPKSKTIYREVHPSKPVYYFPKQR